MSHFYILGYMTDREIIAKLTEIIRREANLTLPEIEILDIAERRAGIILPRYKNKKER